MLRFLIARDPVSYGLCTERLPNDECKFPVLGILPVSEHLLLNTAEPLYIYYNAYSCAWTGHMIRVVINAYVRASKILLKSLLIPLHT
jgi:hypothetical protein